MSRDGTIDMYGWGLSPEAQEQEDHDNNLEWLPRCADDNRVEWTPDD